MRLYRGFVLVQKKQKTFEQAKLKIDNNSLQNIWFHNSNLRHFLWFIQKSCRKIVWKWVIVACFIIRKACFCSCAFNMTSLNVFWKPFVPNRCKMCQFCVIFCHFVNKYKKKDFAHQTQWARYYRIFSCPTDTKMIFSQTE